MFFAARMSIRKMKLSILLVLFLTSLLLSSVVAEVVESPSKAVKVAYEYTGFNELLSIKDGRIADIAKVVSIHDTLTPFLAEEVRSCRIWKVVAERVYLGYKGWKPSVEADYNPRTFEIWIDSASGRFLRAFASTPGLDAGVPDEPHSDSSEVYYGSEKYEAFLSSPPPTNLYKALEAARPCYPRRTREMIIYLVRHSGFSGDEPRNRWMIHSRGQPPINPRYFGEPGMFRVRCVVDALTGELDYLRESLHFNDSAVTRYRPAKDEGGSGE
ncbi:MAG: hypothetical protein P1R58_08640 [bacterium]|nr:hypothetical protein [bacterium]